MTVEGGATVGPDGRELRLTWREAGGPPVAEPARPGYGTLLLSQAIAYGRGGEVALDWRREGLVCTIRVPLAVPEDAATARAQAAHGPAQALRPTGACAIPCSTTSSIRSTQASSSASGRVRRRQCSAP